MYVSIAFLLISNNYYSKYDICHFIILSTNILIISVIITSFIQSSYRLKNEALKGSFLRLASFITPLMRSIILLVFGDNYRFFFVLYAVIDTDEMFNTTRLRIAPFRHRTWRENLRTVNVFTRLLCRVFLGSLDGVKNKTTRPVVYLFWTVSVSHQKPPSNRNRGIIAR